jgi:hypothetical protein
VQLHRVELFHLAGECETWLAIKMKQGQLHITTLHATQAVQGVAATRLDDTCANAVLQTVQLTLRDETCAAMRLDDNT